MVYTRSKETSQCRILGLKWQHHGNVHWKHGNVHFGSAKRSKRGTKQHKCSRKVPLHYSKITKLGALKKVTIKVQLRHCHDVALAKWKAATKQHRARE